MQFIWIVVAVVLVAGVLVSFAVPMEGEDAGAGIPRPAKAMEFVRSWEGTWNAELDLMGQKETGVEVCHSICEGFWFESDFKGTFMGAPFVGHGVYGFDPARAKFVTIWVDSSGGPLTLAEGEFSADGKTYRAEATGLDMSGKPGKFVHETTMRDANTRIFTIRQEGAGEVMKITYRRAN
ncbi:MAG: DUF1579 family protein [Planctomycetes bacterium]|nr:DUF1579 family protein [Planctomycetota bacterium]MCC7168870.1 DUF1579 family protein [Planctomycetota bacterium]